MKLFVKDQARRKDILERGVNVGSQHFRAAPYTGDASAGVLLYHKCYGIEHIAKSAADVEGITSWQA